MTQAKRKKLIGTVKVYAQEFKDPDFTEYSIIWPAKLYRRVYGERIRQDERGPTLSDVACIR